MATHKSADKAARSSERRRMRNQTVRSEVKSTIKKVRDAVAAKKGKEVLLPLLNKAQSVLMRSASKNVLELGTASRYISRLSKLVQKSV